MINIQHMSCVTERYGTQKLGDGKVETMGDDTDTGDDTEGNEHVTCRCR